MKLFYCLFLMFATQFVGADWSSPPTVVYPIQPPYGSILPTIATDPHGNSVAVWFEVIDEFSGFSTMYGATLANGAVDSQGGPAWVLTNPIGPVEASGAGCQSVGVDGNGNAYAIWSDNVNIYVSILPFGSQSWGSPTQINMSSPGRLENPYIVVNPNGDIIASWVLLDFSRGNDTYANAFDASTSLWLGEQVLNFGGSNNFMQLAIDPAGNGVAVFVPNTKLDVLTFTLSTNTWQFVTPIVTADNLANVAVDPLGNALVVWATITNTLSVGNLPFGSTTLTNVQQLTTTAGFADVGPVVQAAANGDGVAIWSDTTGALGSARYSSATGLWTVLPLLTLGSSPEWLDLSTDAAGNMVAIWSVGASGTSEIQAAVLRVTDSAWTLLSTLSPENYNGFPQVVVTATGNAVAIWEDDTNTNLDGTIYSSININIFNASFGPNPPTGFEGIVVFDRFLFQTDRINHLSWTASTSTGVTGYNLYRNGVLIASLGPTVLSYDDHNRNGKVTDVYTLTAVSNGTESSPVQVILP